MPSLRAVVIIDYQNVHLTGHGLFACSRHNPAHEALVDPFYGDLRVMPRWGLSCLVGMLPAARRSA
jgi:hypothetical protein